MRLLHVTEVLRRPEIDFVPPDALYRGRWVHEATAMLDREMITDAIIQAGVAAGWWGFVEAWSGAKSALGLDIVAIEEPVADLRRGYCGTLDRIVKIGPATPNDKRKPGVIDLKLDASCGGKVPATTGMQTAAYVGERKLWRGAVVLHPDGTFAYHDEKDNKDVFRPTDWLEFQHRLAVMRYDIQRGWREMPAEREE